MQSVEEYSMISCIKQNMLTQRGEQKIAKCVVKFFQCGHLKQYKQTILKRRHTTEMSLKKSFHWKVK